MENNFDPKKVTYFGMTDTRGKQTPFGIRAEDRAKHMYIIGKTGMGKSTMLENLAIQDLQNGEGLAFIDPHGGTVEKLLDYVPENRIDDVVYFAPFDMEFPIGFNVMEDVGYDKRHLVVAGLMSAFKRIWVDAWSARMEYILQNTLLALLEHPDTTLIDVSRMYVNKAFRDKVVEGLKDPIVKKFWAEEFAGFSDRYAQEATPAIQNKIGQFTANPLVRNIIGQAHSTFDIRELMDNKKIFLVNLSKGRMGEQNAELLGSILVTKMYLSAMSRAEDDAATLAKLPPFYLYVDEFQSVVNDSFANILSEARKYKLALTIAHQYIAQMEDNIRDAVFGNVGTTVTFRIGPFDAEVMETVFAPTFEAEDIVNLGFTQIYLSLMIDGVGSAPFSAKTLPPVEEPPYTFRDRIIARSQEKYGRPRAEIENSVLLRAEEDKELERAASRDVQKNIDNNSQRKSVIQKKGPLPVKPAPTRPLPTAPPAAAKPFEKESNTTQVSKNPSEILKKQPLAPPSSASAPQAKATEATPQTSSGTGQTTNTRQARYGKEAPQSSPPAVTKKDTTPSKEREALRGALADIVRNAGMDNNPPRPKSSMVRQRTPIVHQSKHEKQKSPLPNTSNDSKKKEVPEHVLRKILELD